MSLVTERWRIWDAEPSYGDTLFKRATGELPEMESSKKMAREVARVFAAGDTILDVGCGAGHYARSLEAVLPQGFSYTGVDATPYYVERAREAFANRPNFSFRLADIFDLPLDENSYDVVMCNNVLLHLPSIKRPLEELIRVARKTVLVRFLCGDRSFRIQDVQLQTDGSEFDENGEPISFGYFNIYSENYVSQIVSALPGVTNHSITLDRDMDHEKIVNSISDHNGARDASKVVGDFLANGYILQPWSILQVTLGA